MEKEIKNILESILLFKDDEEKEIFNKIISEPKILSAKECLKKNDIDGFYFGLIYPLKRTVSDIIESEIPNSQEALFLLQELTFVELQFKKMIEKYEGSPCCADKTRTILKGLLNFFVHKQEIVFNYEQKYTYHLPKVIFTKHEEIIVFFKAIYRFYYGYSEDYIEYINKLEYKK